MRYTKKLQEGGLITYRPALASGVGSLGAPEGASSEAKSSKIKSGSILDEDIIKELMKGEGLTNDTNKFLEDLMKIEQSSTHPYLKSNNRIASLAVVSKYVEIKNNKQNWTIAKASAEKSGGLGEIAVGNQGEVFVKDLKTNAIKGISVENYKNNSKDLHLLSVSELLEERNSNPYLTGQNSILSIASSSIGMDNIIVNIQKVISALGTQESKSEYVYDKQQGSEQARKISAGLQAGKPITEGERKGFELLNRVMGSPERYHKVTEESSTEKRYLTDALEYIKITLGDSSLRKLTAQAGLKGVKVDDLLMTHLVFGHNDKQSISTSGIAEKVDKGAKGSSGSKTDPRKPMTNTQMIFNGTLGNNEPFNFNNTNSKTQYRGKVIGRGPLTDPDGAALGPTTVLGMMKSGWEQMVETESVFFGNKKVNPMEFTDITIDGRSEMAVVYLPADENGAPDNSSLESFKEVMDYYEKIKDTPEATPEAIKEMFASQAFDVTIGENGKLDVTAQGNNVKPFMLFYGFTNAASNLVKGNDDERIGGLSKVTGEFEDMTKRVTDAAWTVKDGKKYKVDRPRQFGVKNVLYGGVVAVGLRHGVNQKLSAYVDSGPTDRLGTREEVTHRSQNTTGEYNESNINDLIDTN